MKNIQYHLKNQRKVHEIGSNESLHVDKAFYDGDLFFKIKGINKRDGELKP